jgi:hypothetical protein
MYNLHVLVTAALTANWPEVASLLRLKRNIFVDLNSLKLKR